MDGSTFQPPIHLDPNQDPSQQAAFINQNFQNLAATLESNSFRVVSTINSEFILPAVPGVTNGWSYGNQTVTIPHGLNITPLPFGAFFDGSTYTQLPDTKLNFVSPSSPYWEQWRVRVDATNVYLDTFVTAFNLTVTGPSTYPAVILLLQQVAN